MKQHTEPAPYKLSRQTTTCRVLWSALAISALVTAGILSGTWWMLAGVPVWCVVGLTANTVWQRQ